MKNKSTNSSPAPIHTLRHTERTPSGIRRTQRPLCVGGKCLSGRRVRPSRPSRRSGAKSSSPLLKPFDSEHVTFAIFMSESRRFFEEYNRGWHLGDNVGMMAFDMSKPCIENWKLKFGNCYCKGYGMTIGLCVNCEYRFAGRWLLAAYFGRYWMDSRYNGYSDDGWIDTHSSVVPYNPNTPIHSTTPRSGISTRSVSSVGYLRLRRTV